MIMSRFSLKPNAVKLYDYSFELHQMCITKSAETDVVFIDRVAGEIIRLVASVCVCPSVSVGALLFEPFDLDFRHKCRT